MKKPSEIFQILLKIKKNKISVFLRQIQKNEGFCRNRWGCLPIYKDKLYSLKADDIYEDRNWDVFGINPGNFPLIVFKYLKPIYETSICSEHFYAHKTLQDITYCDLHVRC
jgi:hypothetical protein